MMQVHAEIWNEIAQTQPLETRWARQAFALDQEQLTALLEDWGNLLAKAGHSPGVVLAYQVLTPLVIERRAIQAYLAETEKPDLMGALPEINSPAEALTLAARDYKLTPRDLSDLEAMLKRLRWSGSDEQTAA